jgi:hypothetical protein
MLHALFMCDACGEKWCSVHYKEFDDLHPAIMYYEGVIWSVACKKTHIRVELQENNGLAGEGHYVIP